INQLSRTHLDLLIEASQNQEDTSQVTYQQEQEKTQNRLTQIEDTLNRLTEINQLSHTHLDLLIEASQNQEDTSQVTYQQEQEKIQFQLCQIKNILEQLQNSARIWEENNKENLQLLDIKEYEKKIKELTTQKQQAIEELNYITEELEKVDTETKLITNKLEEKYHQELQQMNTEKNNQINQLQKDHQLEIEDYQNQLNLQSFETLEKLAKQKQQNLQRYEQVSRTLKKIDTEAKIVTEQVKATTNYPMKLSLIVGLIETIFGYEMSNEERHQFIEPYTPYDYKDNLQEETIEAISR
ncbi:MAG: hypothetical protein AB4062_03875, partial [Crocosphaera sp.]